MKFNRASFLDAVEVHVGWPAMCGRSSRSRDCVHKLRLSRRMFQEMDFPGALILALTCAGSREANIVARRVGTGIISKPWSRLGEAREAQILDARECEQVRRGGWEASDNRGRLARDECRRIEMVQDALCAGGLDDFGRKALREQIDKARQRINAVCAEHEQAEMKRIRERADARDREEARAATRPQPYVGTDNAGLGKSRDLHDAIWSITSGNDKGAKDARDDRRERREKAEADADAQAEQQGSADIRAAKRAARDAGAGI